MRPAAGSPVVPDVIRECLTIAAGTAFRALSDILGETIVRVEAPFLVLDSRLETLRTLGGAGAEVPAVALRLRTAPPRDDTALSGSLLWLFAFREARRLLDLLGLSKEPGALRRSALLELATILSGHFVRALYELSGVEIRITPPEYRVDMAGSLVASFLALAQQQGDGDGQDIAAVIFRTELGKVRGLLLWVPEVSAVQMVFKRLEAEL